MRRAPIRIDHDHAAAVEAFGRDVLATTLTFDLPIIGAFMLVHEQGGPVPEFRLAFRKEQEEDCILAAQIEARWGGSDNDDWDPVDAPYATARVRLRDSADDAMSGRAALTLLGAMQVVAEQVARDLRELDAEHRRFQQDDAVAV
jgi:hypothetical protein